MKIYYIILCNFKTVMRSYMSSFKGNGDGNKG